MIALNVEGLAGLVAQLFACAVLVCLLLLQLVLEVKLCTFIVKRTATAVMLWHAAWRSCLQQQLRRLAIYITDDAAARSLHWAQVLTTSVVWVSELEPAPVPINLEGSRLAAR